MGFTPPGKGPKCRRWFFYTFIFQQSPAELVSSAGLPEETAKFLQAAAAETVLENFED